MREIEKQSGQADALINWFRTLPVFIDLPDIKIVHACWDKVALNYLNSRLNEENSLPENLFAAACKKGTPEHRAREALLNGPELDLPEGTSFQDKDGNHRTAMRLKWGLSGNVALS